MHTQQAQRLVNYSYTHGAARIAQDGIVPSRRALTAACIRAQEGDERAREQVIRMTSRLAYKLASRTFISWASKLPPSASFDDVYQAALIGVNHAIDKYDASTGYAFTTYADNWIRSKAQREVFQQISHMGMPEDAIRTARPDDRALAMCDASISQPLASSESDAQGREGDALSTVLACEHSASHIDDTLDDIDLAAGATAILDAIGDLTERQRAAILMHADGASQTRISDHLGVTRQRVHALLKRAREQVADTVSA